MSAKLTLGLCTDHRRLDANVVSACDIVLLPELVDGGYAALSRGEGTHMSGDALLQQFADLTRHTDTILAAGSVRLSNGKNDFTNTALVFRGGKQILRYDKIHLFRPTGDHRFFRPGDAIRTATISRKGLALCFGVIVCYDLRFPELPRRVAFQGADILLVPARWPAVRADAWRTLLKARAIENQIFVAGCNAAGKEGGPSFVFDPMGRRVEESASPKARGWKVFTLDLEGLKEATRLFDSRKEKRLVL